MKRILASLIVAACAFPTSGTTQGQETAAAPSPSGSAAPANPSGNASPPVEGQPATPVPGASAEAAETITETTAAVAPPAIDIRRIVDPKEEKVLLQFRDQDWVTALTWLADKLQLNLDWKTIPNDKLSLASTQEITLEAAEDMFNMQLLSRGFVLLKRDGVLRLVTLSDLDITLVPRVSPDELATMPKHSVARVSFPLDWMLAEEAAKELQPLLSPFGKLSPMASANRLEVVDAVVNLREFQRMLSAAEKDDARKERVAEFRLKFRRVEDVAPKVRQLLGLPPDSSGNGSQNQLDIEQARFKAEAMKQLGREARELVQDKKVTIFVAVNDKENSLLVNAPPNKIEIVRQAVEAFDKPLAEQESAWETISRVKVYDVVGFEPDAVTKLVSSLQERGNIAKDARIQFEAAYNRIIVFASPNDQLTVAQLIESFRSEKRTATVLPLSSVDPTYAAKAVQLILKAPDRAASVPGLPSDGKFQVEADPKNHRLLLWATNAELSEVREFLARLGESFSDRPVDSKLHVIDTRGQDTDEIKAKLKRIWAEISDAPLLLDSLDSNDPKGLSPKSSQKPASDIQSADADKNRKNEMKFVAAVKDAIPSDGTKSDSQSLPPVRLLENGSGNLVVLSKDPIAAETAKRLIDQLLKDESEFRAITLKHAQATAVRRQLETMLQFSPSNLNSKLYTSAAPVVFDVDSRTNRIIIQNADEAQWKTIKESVEILDQPNPDDEKLERQKVTYRFKYRKASIVADALKEVYSDLLNFSDRTMANLSYRTSTFNKNIAATTNNPEYHGLLSFSVDQQANLIIISAPKYLTEEVIQLVESMDKPEDGNAIAVLPAIDLPFSADTNASKTSENLRRLLRGK